VNNLVIKLSGEIQSSNFHEWKNELIGQIQSTNLELTTDADFAAAELNVKTFRIAEKTLKNAKESAIHQAYDIQELFNAIDEVTEQARQVRLTLVRQIKKRKSDVKEEIALEGVNIMKIEITQQSDNFNLTDNSRFTDKSIFLSKTAGTRGVAGARKAVELLCYQMKDEISKKVLWVESNATTIDTIPLEHSALFQDRAYLIGLLPNDLNKTIDDRINTYITNQKIINKKQIIQDETSAELKPMGILETKGVITTLLNSSIDEDIIRALMTCLRLLEDENMRHKDEKN
jgi:hypothetical protein